VRALLVPILVTLVTLITVPLVLVFFLVRFAWSGAELLTAILDEYLAGVIK